MASILPSPQDCCQPCDDCPVVTNIPGSPGSPAIAEVEPPGENCANGGIKVTDGEGNVSYVCNGDPGEDSSITVEAESPGANCAAGGIKVTDSDGNISYVCNGEDAAGTNGTNGINAFTVTTANFTQPAEGATVNIAVASSAWIASGQHLYVTGGGDYAVTAIPDSTHVTIRNLENTGSALYPGNAAPTTVIGSGAAVSPGGIQGPLGATGAAGPTTLGTARFHAVKNGTNQTIGSGSHTGVTFGTELFDPDGVWNAGTSLFTAPATGVYLFSLQVTSELVNADPSSNVIGLYKNGAFGVGTLVAEYSRTTVASGGTENQTLSIVTLLSLTAADTIQCDALQTGGGVAQPIIGANADTFFAGFRVA